MCLLFDLVILRIHLDLPPLASLPYKFTENILHYRYDYESMNISNNVVEQAEQCFKNIGEVLER